MQTATGSVYGKGRPAQFLSIRQVDGSKVLPYAVYGGNVHSFKVDYDDSRSFSGERLRIGQNGKIYAVFSDEFEADQYRKHFVGCALSSFDGYMNAYCLGKAR